MEYLPQHVVFLLVPRQHSYVVDIHKSWQAAGGCGFVGWRDPPMCSRSVDIIPCLLRKNNMHEEAAKMIVFQNRCL
ncbi:hypothetical protein R6Q59_025479 [Mikania micrantha]